MNIPQLFIKLFVPTLLGLVFNAMLTLADGIFVGQGVGSNALAAVNIAAPIFLLGLGMSLMFATGVSVVAAVHLSRGNNKAANINATQALTVPFAIMSVVSMLIAVFAPQLCYLFGGSQTLEPLVVEYLTYISPIPALTVLVHVGSFIIRLDGSPKYAMYTSVIPAVLNIFLDWLFVFPLNLGLMGAASATSISEAVGAVMAVAYLVYFPKTIHLYRPQFTRTNYGQSNPDRVRHTLRLSLALTAVSGLIISILGMLAFRPLISLFLAEGSHAFNVCADGFPLFAISFVFFSLNVVIIGFYQSVERASEAISFMFLRGFVLVIPIFIALPHLIGVNGLWLAVPLSEALTFVVLVVWSRQRLIFG